MGEIREYLRRRRPPLHVPRHRRDDRQPGRGIHRGRVPPGTDPRRRHPHQARRRRPRGAALSVKEVVGRPIAFVDRRAPRRLRPVPSGSHGRPDSRHGRRAQSHRTGRADHGPRRRDEGRRRDRRGEVHARGLPRTTPAGPQDGLDVRDALAPAGSLQGDEAGLGVDRRPAGEPSRGHHPLHDARRACRTSHHRRSSPCADREGVAPGPPRSTCSSSSSRRCRR